MNRKAISCYRPDVYANDEIYQVLPEDLGAAVEKSASMAKIVYWPLVAQKGEIATEMVQVFYDVIKGNRTVEDGLAHSGRYDRDLERDGVEYKKAAERLPNPSGRGAKAARRRTNAYARRKA